MIQSLSLLCHYVATEIRTLGVLLLLVYSYVLTS